MPDQHPENPGDADPDPGREALSGMVGRLEALAGRPVTAITRPGGPNRDVLRVTFAAGPNWILTRRPTTAATARERLVLEGLARVPCPPVPQLIGQVGDWVVSSDLGATKFSIALHRTPPADRWAMVERALAGVLELQDAANRSGIALHLPRIELSRAEIRHVAKGPDRTRKLYDLPGRGPDPDALVPWLHVERPKFVKWDARAANMVVAENGTIGWIDFEHAGLRHGCEDLAWLLCDETMPLDLGDHLDRIDALIRSHRPRAPETYLKRFCIYAALQAGVRLRVMRNEITKKSWTPIRDIFRGDLVGANPHLGERLARNGAMFADTQTETRPMVPMYREIAAQMAAVRQGDAPPRPPGG